MPSAPLGAIRQFTSVTATATAAFSISFTTTAIIGNYASMSSTVQMAFAASIVPSSIQGLAASDGLTFTTTPKVTVAGKPIEIVALPSSFDIRAANDSYDVTAPQVSYDVRGWR